MTVHSFDMNIEAWHGKLPHLSTLQDAECAIMAFSFPDLFDNYMQQDAHEFLNYLLNTIADILQEEKKQEKQNGKLKNGNMNEPAESNKPELTWVHEIFQGTLTNETRCLNCETVSPWLGVGDDDVYLFGHMCWDITCLPLPSVPVGHSVYYISETQVETLGSLGSS